jgi:hypothetical protein
MGCSVLSGQEGKAFFDLDAGRVMWQGLDRVSLDQFLSDTADASHASRRERNAS